jgi:ADP-ribosylglycohydrolase
MRAPMLPSTEDLRKLIGTVLDDLDVQGHEVADAQAELASTPSSYDALLDFVQERLGNGGPSMRADWPYVEPDDLDEIRRDWPSGPSTYDIDDASDRVRAAFTARVCGCMLGKPFEIFVSLDEIRAALEPAGEWPLRDYPSETALRGLPTLQGQWRELHRDGITHVAEDDDINYTILAMLLLESHGLGFTHDAMRTQWLYNLPVLVTFGPERTRLMRSGLASITGADPELARLLNPGAELCGALIRADAYGYACMGRPDVAAELAHRDASFTHRRTGVYGAMFVAAAIAVAAAMDDPLDIVRTALDYVPQRSRFAERVREALAIVERADDWIDAHRGVRERLGAYGFCQIYQEVGTLINTLRFADGVAEGICIQVMQGNDTDSFGATAGSILGAFRGAAPDERWTRRFNDDVHTALALFHERSLAAITERMAALPTRVADDLADR